MQLSLDTALLSVLPAPATRASGGATFILPAPDGAAVIDGPNYAGAGKDLPPAGPPDMPSSIPATPTALREVPVLALVSADTPVVPTVPQPLNPVALLAARLTAVVAARSAPDMPSATRDEPTADDEAPGADTAIMATASAVATPTPFAPLALALPLPDAAPLEAPVPAPVAVGGVTTAVAAKPVTAASIAMTPTGTTLDEILAKIAAVVAPGTHAADVSAPPASFAPAQPPIVPIASVVPAAKPLPTTAEMFGLVSPRDTQSPAVDVVVPASALAATHAIAATGAAHDAGGAPLDLHQEAWPQAMIDRIEALRDAAEETSTRIRVVPDALGPIDLSLRREGEAVHVRLAAEHAATRALLAETQRTLTDIADQRGVKLASTTVEHGPAGEQSGRGWQQGAPSPFARPASPTSATTAAVIEVADDDTRIA